MAEVTVKAKPVVTLPDMEVYERETVTIPAECFSGKAWKLVKSQNTNYVAVAVASGEAGTDIVLHAVKTYSSAIAVTFETADTAYTVDVLINRKPPTQVKCVTIDSAISQSRTFEFDGAGSDLGCYVNSGDCVVTNAYWIENGKAKITVTPVQLGKTSEIQLESGDNVYLLTVAVLPWQRTIAVPRRSTVTLSASAGDLFDSTEILTASSADSSVASVSMTDTAVTITGVAEGMTTMKIKTDDRFFDYTITVTAPRAEMKRIALTGIGGSVEAEKLGGRVMEATTDNPAIATVTSGENGKTATISGVAPGTTTVHVKTLTMDYAYTIRVVSDEVHVVHFCEGDKTQIWYNDTTGNPDWHLLVNDTRYELDQKAEGGQIGVTLTRMNDQLTYIIATADRVGDINAGDLVVISDGRKCYTYRMSCSPAREVMVGESTNMVCRTVAVNK